MSKKGTLDKAVLTLAVIGSLVFVNILGLRTFKRLDLTRDQQFTLSSATVGTLQDLGDPVTIRAYFTKDLPSPFSTNARYVRDLLEEYYVHAEGNLIYEFIDPASAETDEDKEKKKEVQTDVFGRAVREQTSIEREIQSLGVVPVQVRVNEGDKLEIKRAYMGLAVSHGGKSEAIPVVQDTAGLEYDLTTVIRKLTREKRSRIALLVGHEGPDPRTEMGRAVGVLGQLYDIAPLDLMQDPKIGDEVDTLLVVGPKTPLSDAEQRAIDAFVGRGGSAAFLLDGIAADLQTMRADPADHGLSPLLRTYGVSIEPGLVLDAECATISVAQQQGFLRFQQPVRYPFLPQPSSLESASPLTQGLSSVVFPFMSPLRSHAVEGVASEILVRSSAQSWIHLPPYDLNPMRQWRRDDIGAQSARDLMVALDGVTPSHFGETAERQSARIVVAGGAAFVGDQFFAQGNEALLLNLMDWLVYDDALLAVRSRGLKAAPLAEIPESRRATVKYANILGVPLAFIVFGLLRWRRREARRAGASVD